MKRRTVVVTVLVAVALVPPLALLAQLGGAHWLAVPLSEDPGISWMVLTDAPDYRILRDFAEPGATRSMHHHADATWHIFTLASGKLMLTVEGEPPREVTSGESLALKGGVNHTFRNVGATTATIVEVFGKK
jgi:quercetin dioxygenase-like cupin family protein